MNEERNENLSPAQIIENQMKASWGAAILEDPQQDLPRELLARLAERSNYDQAKMVRTCLEVSNVLSQEDRQIWLVGILLQIFRAEIGEALRDV